jgi:Ca2+-binding EF-hand superfamily protein
MTNRGVMFDRLDANRDGAISRDEFARAPALEHQQRLARGGGQLGMRGMGMGGLRGRMFEMADVNRDNRVSLQEATAAAYRRFDMTDVNRDGQITREERMQVRQQMRAQRQRG